MLHCTPFLLFDGNCADAMTFYKSCLGGELTMTKTGDSPMRDQFPESMHNKIINANLKSGSIEFSATDWHADTLKPKQGNMFSIFLTGSKYDELKTVFEKLSVDADKDKRTFIELHQMPFGLYGQFTDKFGVSWVFVSNNK